jgi:hypothetical protein
LQFLAWAYFLASSRFFGRFCKSQIGVGAITHHKVPIAKAAIGHCRIPVRWSNQRATAGQQNNADNPAHMNFVQWFAGRSTLKKKIAQTHTAIMTALLAG